MSDLDHTLLRKLAEWETAGVPITSVYVTVDGRRFPRKSDYEVRLDELLRRARSEAEPGGREALRSVERDVLAMSGFVREEFDRGDTRGLGMFSSHDAGLWEVVGVPRPVRDRVTVSPTADLLPLEVLLETYRPTCAALVDHARARLFVVELGRIEGVAELSDEVPGRHDQGGWAQMRMQRHVDEHRTKHLKRVAEELFALWRRRRFEHLVLSGPADARSELESMLHDYLVRRVRARLSLPLTAGSGEVLRKVLAVEEDLEREREREVVRRLRRAAGANDHGVAGLEETLETLAAGRVAELVVALELSRSGAACTACGRLAPNGSTCPTCGADMVEVPDVVEAAVAQAFRLGCRVETVLEANELDALGGIGAVLRF
ncbi:MAG TPA: Vms1/Ankzf1 family peptidyl-tRNA hydrolase [Actinomycetota bacterium]